MPEWEVLGKAPPPVPAFPADPRELGALFARRGGVSEAAIASVLAEPMTPERENWQGLWWSVAMVKRDAELLPQGPPARGLAPVPRPFPVFPPASLDESGTKKGAKPKGKKPG